jgi:hypothetical protein
MSARSHAEGADAMEEMVLGCKKCKYFTCKPDEKGRCKKISDLYAAVKGDDFKEVDFSVLRQIPAYA